MSGYFLELKGFNGYMKIDNIIKEKGLNLIEAVKEFDENLNWKLKKWNYLAKDYEIITISWGN